MGELSNRITHHQINNIMNEEQLLKEPYISYFHNIFTDEECNFVIDASEKYGPFEESKIYNTTMKRSELAKWRTSTSFVDEDNHFNDIRQKCYLALKDKFSTINDFNIEHFEKIQIQRYHEGQFVGSHVDCFNSINKHTTDSDKIATLIVYLNDNFDGGETFFNTLGIKSKPKKGCGLFFYYDYGAEINEKTKHEGLPVTNGTKYIITCWIRKKPIGGWIKNE